MYANRTIPLPQYMSDAGRNALEAREGLELKAYKDSGGRWTIGYGRAYAVYPGDVIDKEQADHFLAIDVLVAISAIHRNVHVPLNQTMVDALGSFIYNIGVAAFERSDVLRHLNASVFQRAANDMLGWNKVHGEYLQALYDRRKSEVAQFNA